MVARRPVDLTLMNQAPRELLLQALVSITGTGVFCATDARPFFMPELVVEGVGEIAFPLSPAQFGELRRCAEAAPYGKGMQTLTDDTVRKCWQIDASKFRFEAAEWHDFVRDTVTRVAEALGVEGEVAAEPYKLLLYEKGGHFLPHRDTEKLDAMFGTLIIALPSAHEGGRLRVRHAGQEVVVDFSARERRAQFQSAAFFADCEHEVEPVTAGVRCCLVYNLRLVKGEAAEFQRSLVAQASRLVPALNRIEWGDMPQPVAVLLEHRYTEASFSLAHLKGHDGSRARALIAAANDSGLVAHLALITFHRVGDWPDGYDQGYSSRWRRHDHRQSEPIAKSPEMGEVYEESILASHWREADDQPALIGRVRLDEDALIAPPDVFNDDPDESESEGYTGNAGCTIEHWYRRAAVILWPRGRHESVVCGIHFAAACAYLHRDSLDETRRRSPEFRRLLDEVTSRLADNLPPAHSLFHSILLPNASDSDKAEEPSGNVVQWVLAALANVREAKALDGVMQKLPPTALILCDATTWKNLVNAFGIEVLRPTIQKVLNSEATECRSAAFTLLEGLMDAGLDAEIRSLAMRLAALPPRPPQPAWPPNPKASAGDPREIALMLRSSRWISAPPDAQRLADFLLGDRSLPYLRTMFIPSFARFAALVPSKPQSSRSAPNLAVLAAIDVFEEEVARPLVPFPDWVRPCPVPTNPESRTSPPSSRHDKGQSLEDELRTFMADPLARQHTFARAQAQREAIIALIHHTPLDLDFQTIRSGSPHKLVCTKNSASYHRAVEQRTHDLAHLSLLRGFLA